MSILGELIVKLSANTASFTEGLSGAAKTAKTAGRDIESTFSSLGNVASRALAPFGEVGAAMAATLGGIGSAANSAIQSFSKMGGAMGAVAGLSAGAAAALGTISLGALALAAHTAESIAKLGELSQSTGVSVGALSGLGFAGRAVGIDMETMAKSLEKMDKAVFKAATAPAGTVNAFTRLHIALRDTTGQIKPTEEIFGELAAKFAAMPDGVTKSALAMEIFSKGGAVMIPLLNKGKEGIQEFLNTAKSLGIVLDDQTVQSAAKFKVSMATLEAAGQGVAIRLTQDLLPALNALSEKLVDSFKTGEAQKLIDMLADLVKEVLSLGYAITHLPALSLGTPGAVASEFTGTTSVLAIQARDLLEKLPGLPSDVAKRMHEQNAAEIAAIWKDTAAKVNQNMNGITWAKFTSDVQNFRKSLDKPAAGPFDWAKDILDSFKKPKGSGADEQKERGDTAIVQIKARIEALAKEAAGWGLMASAGTQAERLIAEAVKKGDEEISTLRERAAKDKLNPAGAAALVDKNDTFVRFQAAKKIYETAINSLNTELDKQTDKFKEDEKASLAMAAAYDRGGAAIAAAAIDKQFAADAAKAGVLFDALGHLTPRLQEAKDAKVRMLTADLQEQLKKEAAATSALRPYVDALNASYLKGADAVRANRIELEVQRFALEQTRKGINVTPEMQQKERSRLSEDDREAYQATINQAAAQYDLNLQYKDEFTKLERIREVLQQNGRSTLLLDAQEFDAQNRLLHLWDEAALKVGTFGQKFHGVMGELVLQGRQAGEAIARSFLTAIDSIETEFAKLLTGQKANFKQVFQSLAESIAKAGIQHAVGGIAEKLGIHLPGDKPDGSADKPFHVILGNALTGLGGGNGDTGGDGGSGGWLGGILKKLGLGRGSGGASASGSGAGGGMSAASGGGPGSALPGLLTGGLQQGLTSYLTKYFTNLFTPSPSIGDVGGGMAGFSDFFGGSFAEGGDMTPGKWYIAGEKGPEIIGPKNRGMSVMPMSQAGSSGGKAPIHITNNFNGFKDTDMFRHSASQVAQAFHRQASLAYSRS